MRTNLLKLFLACLLTALTSIAKGQTDADITVLIDQLVEVKEPGYGYSGTFSGTQFLPVEGSEQANMLLLTQHGTKKSEVMTKLVAAGAKAVPLLLEHLDDARAIKLKPISGMMWVQFGKEYDWNSRSTETPDFIKNQVEQHPSKPFPRQLFVGDLAYVALGQILNRNYVAARYQATGGLVINSPVGTKELKEQVLKDWGDFSIEKHREKLIEDLSLPDHESRRAGAVLRLAYYYPESLETNVLKVFSLPTYDVYKVENWVTRVLYKASGSKRQKEVYEKFCSSEGSGVKDGILLQLYDDLDWLEAIEEKRSSEKTRPYGNHPRAALINLYQKPDTIRSRPRPFVEAISKTDLARFITVLSQDTNKAIDQAVYEIFLSAGDDDYLVLACMKRLIGKGFDKEFLQYCERREKRSEYGGKDLREMHTKLQRSLKASSKE